MEGAIGDPRRVPIMRKGFNKPTPVVTAPLPQAQASKAKKRTRKPKASSRISRVKTATIAKPPEGRVSNAQQVRVELLNETDAQQATNVMNKPDNTDLDKLTKNNTTNTDE